MKFSIVGGDRRLACMADILKNMGHEVLTFCLDSSDIDRFNFKKAGSFKDALKFSKFIICPIPFSRDGKFINSTCDGNCKKLTIYEFKKNISKNQYVFGGCIQRNIVSYLKFRNIFSYDYMQNVEFIAYNSIITAEAAIAQAILYNSTDMHFSNCLVLGFGNCGRTIASKLKGLCNNVFVCTENANELALAASLGFKSFKINSLEDEINNFKYIFNTIPVKLLCGCVLNSIISDALILDITGCGVNIKECEFKKINTKISLAIPGKFKFRSEAKFLSELTLKIIGHLKVK